MIRLGFKKPSSFHLRKPRVTPRGFLAFVRQVTDARVSSQAAPAFPWVN